MIYISDHKKTRNLFQRHDAELKQKCEIKQFQTVSGQVTFNWSCSNCIASLEHPECSLLGGLSEVGAGRLVPACFSVNAQNASCVTPDWIIQATYSPSALPKEHRLKSSSQKWKEATFFWILSRNATDNAKTETTFCSRRLMDAPQWAWVVGSRAVPRLLAGSKQKKMSSPLLDLC